MLREINANLPQNSFRIVCKNCGYVYEQNKGNLTKAAISSMKYKSQNCKNCGGELILETNSKDMKPKYDQEHPYMGGLY